LKRINAISESQWLGIYRLTKIGSASGELAPNLWPAIEKLILRRIQNAGEFFDEDLKSKLISPEVYYYLTLVSKNFKNTLENMYGLDKLATMPIIDAINSIPHKEEIETRAIEEIERMYTVSGIEFNRDYINENAVSIFVSIVKNVSTLKPKRLRSLDNLNSLSANAINDDEDEDDAD
jgi:hypothetical protein